MKTNYLLLALFVLMILVTTRPAALHAQTQKSDNTLALEKNARSPTASIDDVSWIAGHWQGQAIGGDFEETWNPPLGGTMVGMFKFSQGNKVGFYELLTIVEENESLMLRLKHFDKSLKGWEEKDDSVEFPLVKLTPHEAYFDGLTFRKVDDETMHIFVVVRDDDKSQELKFAGQRAASKGGDINVRNVTHTAANKSAAESILAVYEIDRIIAQQRDHLPEQTTLGITVQSYVRGLDAIDFSNCPDDFTAAYKKHRDAWNASQPFFEQFDDLHGEMHGLFDEIREMKGAKQAELDKHYQTISDTWTAVEAAAKNHGVEN